MWLHAFEDVGSIHENSRWVNWSWQVGPLSSTSRKLGFVDNGAIEYAGNKIGEVLDRLLGGEEGRTKLRALVADPGGRLAAARLSMEKDGRLTAFTVPRVFLKRVTPQTLGRALASVKRMAEERIRFIRDKHRGQRSFQEGRLHAHFALLYANALLASRQFPEPDA